MPITSEATRRHLVRLVIGESGKVPMAMELVMRFDYGRTVPWVHRRRYGLTAFSGPNTIDLQTPVELEGVDFRTISRFTVSQGDRVPFIFTWRPPTVEHRSPVDAEDLIDDTDRWWRIWAQQCHNASEWEDARVRSLITLKGLTDATTGGIVAAPTTSLPEWVGGRRNWDYRFCWLRDATFTLYSLLISGLTEEALQWRDWLLRAAAGKPDQIQSVYGVSGERLLPEVSINWLGGYEGSTPVRLGNKAAQQLQIDVYGEILDVFHVCRRVGIEETDDSWGFQEALLDFLESGWRRADNGIWEVRGPRRRFTHSQVLAWVGLDRATRAVDQFELPGDVDKWRRLRDRIHAEVCAKGYDSERNAFVQYFGSRELDASLLLIPLVGFLPPTDPRVRGTLHAIEEDLMVDGFVRRYIPSERVERLRGPEGAFLPCTFWLADNYAIMGEMDKARSTFERLLSIRNDVGLLAEEYDPRSGRQLGNFPQAFSHVCLVNTAQNLAPAGPALLRSRSGPPITPEEERDLTAAMTSEGDR
jgi:GH15 family glucan-1,4-alpha-glucosidase